jgi:hypothetical protein
MVHIPGMSASRAKSFCSVLSKVDVAPEKAVVEFGRSSQSHRKSPVTLGQMCSANQPPGARFADTPDEINPEMQPSSGVFRLESPPMFVYELDRTTMAPFGRCGIFEKPEVEKELRDQFVIFVDFRRLLFVQGVQ